MGEIQFRVVSKNNKNLIKALADAMNYALWLFSNGVYKPMAFDIAISNENEMFFPHWREKAQLHKSKLTEGQKNVAWTWWQEDDTSVFAGFLRWKSSQKRLSLSLSSVYCGCWSKIIFLSLVWKLFCCWIENCFCRWPLYSELLCFSVNSKLFLPRFLSLIASLQATGVVLSLYQHS